MPPTVAAVVSSAPEQGSIADGRRSDQLTPMTTPGAMDEFAHPDRDDLSVEQLVALLVERGVPEQVARERVAKLQHAQPTVIGRRGEPIPIEETEIDVWLSLGSFG
jgi:hypothetical protein